MNLIYRKSCRNVCYFYPDSKDKESPMCTSMSTFFHILYLMLSPCNARIIATGTYVTRREVRHKILIKKITLVRRVASIIADPRYQFSREQFSLSRDSSAIKARRERSFA